MSVINQMLKDLDQRQVEEKTPTGTSQQPLSSTNTNKSLIVIVGIIISLNIIGVVFWYLYQENQSLKSQQTEYSNNTVVTSQSKDRQSLVDSNSKMTAPIEKDNRSLNEVNKEANVAASKLNKSELAQVESPVDSKHAKKSSNAHGQTNEKPTAEMASYAKPLVNNTNANVSNTAPNRAVQVAEPSTNLPSSLERNNSPKLTIERRQLTPQQLIEQKSQRAQQAIAANDTKKAEQLFEEILVIEPSHKSSRKQLAALWFGRQDYRSALNLLMQGISLDNQDAEFRIMQARIYLKQEQMMQAFESLRRLKDIEHIEYQSLLANVSQQIKQFDSAINAYRILTEMEPEKGRWWLGYGVALDSNGQYRFASTAYNKANSTTDLSDNARQFIRQRLAEIGE